LVLASGRLLEALMTRIVRTAYRYRRPPRKRRAVALEVPAVVKAAEPAKASKRAKSAEPVDSGAVVAALANDAVLLSRIADFPAPVSLTGAPLTDRKPAERPPAASAIVTIRSRKHTMLAHLLEDMTPEELQRRGDAADAMMREIKRRIAKKPGGYMTRERTKR
jgi:hypothetical protein